MAGTALLGSKFMMAEAEKLGSTVWAKLWTVTNSELPLTEPAAVESERPVNFSTVTRNRNADAARCLRIINNLKIEIGWIGAGLRRSAEQ